MNSLRMSHGPAVLIRCAEGADAAAIADIYNEAIATTTATFDTEPKSVEDRRQWLARHDERHPVWVAEVDGEVVGWASITAWSDRPAYDDTGETSFYVAEQYRGRGIGRALKAHTVSEARRLGFHTLLARTAQESAASIHINESFGFRHIGTMKEVGLKFGRRLDVHIMQLMLIAPDSGPRDDERPLEMRRHSSTGTPWDAKAEFIESDLSPLPRTVDSLPANELRDFLAASDVIDWREQRIADLAASLSEGICDDEQIARRLFEWVRDNIEHTGDFRRSEVTCRASDVLRIGTGFCYAKSHLLAALLRANQIPCGFCYQRLSLNGEGPPYCLHGLNAVYLKRHGWYRIDPRGNTEPIQAEFSPPTERVAFQVSLDGEADLPDIRPEPLNCVIAALTTANSAETLAANLPDAPPMECPE